MAGRVILIVGLPGSGKTHMINESFKDYIIFDDMKPEYMLDLKLAMLDRKNVVIADPNLCIPALFQSCLTWLHLADANFSNTNLTVYYFDNDPIACKKNVVYRNDGRKVFDYIALLSQYYDPPEPRLPIWKCPEPAQTDDSCSENGLFAHDRMVGALLPQKK